MPKTSTKFLRGHPKGAPNRCGVGYITIAIFKLYLSKGARPRNGRGHDHMTRCLILVPSHIFGIGDTIYCKLKKEKEKAYRMAPLPVAYIDPEGYFYCSKPFYLTYFRNYNMFTVYS